MVTDDPSATAAAAAATANVSWLGAPSTASLHLQAPRPERLTSCTPVEELLLPLGENNDDIAAIVSLASGQQQQLAPPVDVRLTGWEECQLDTELEQEIRRDLELVIHAPRYLELHRDDSSGSQRQGEAAPAALALAAPEPDAELPEDIPTLVSARQASAVLQETPMDALQPRQLSPLSAAAAAPAGPATPMSHYGSEFGSMDSEPHLSRQQEQTCCPDNVDGNMSIDNDVAVSRASHQSMRSSLGRSLRKASQHFKTLLVGDDEEVHDKWDNYHDDDEEEIEAVKRGLSLVMRKKSRSAGAHVSRSGHSKVMPASPSGYASGGRSMEGGLSMDSHSPLEEILGEKRASRTLIWYYGQTCFFSMIVTAVCIPLVQLMSMVSWHQGVAHFNPSDGPADDPAADAGPPMQMPDNVEPIRPNHVALQWMLLLQIVMPLCIYAVLLHACIRRSFSIPWPMVALVAFTVAWSTLVCGMFYKFDVSYWFFYGDLFLIVAAYVPCMCMVGWYVEVDPNATTKHRLMDVAVTAMLETTVAAATLVYCFFIMPLFFTLTNAWLQMLWLCVVHPLYFEATTGFIVRKVLHRNRQLGRNHIQYLLSIVHSMVHVVVLGTSLQASIEPVRILALTVLCYNLAKLMWRSTVIQRDLFVERLFHGWSFNYSSEDLAELSRMVSVGIITEIILENASVFIAPFMMFRMYKEPLFMAVVPNTFFDNGGTYPVSTLITLIALLFSFTATFDLIFYFLNYHMVQHLPLINTWRRIKRSQGWYLMFLIYAFAAMGVVFLFLTMMILPRAAYCKTDNYCDCSTITYQTICQGQYISTMVDYLVAP